MKKQQKKYVDQDIILHLRKKNAPFFFLLSAPLTFHWLCPNKSEFLVLRNCWLYVFSSLAVESLWDFRFLRLALLQLTVPRVFQCHLSSFFWRRTVEALHQPMQFLECLPVFAQQPGNVDRLFSFCFNCSLIARLVHFYIFIHSNLNNDVVSKTLYACIGNHNKPSRRFHQYLLTFSRERLSMDMFDKFDSTTTSTFLIFFFFAALRYDWKCMPNRYDNKWMWAKPFHSHQISSSQSWNKVWTKSQAKVSDNIGTTDRNVLAARQRDKTVNCWSAPNMMSFGPKNRYIGISESGKSFATSTSVTTDRIQW